MIARLGSRAAASLALHRDWLDGYGHRLMAPKAFVYRAINFSEIVNAPPRAR